MGGFVPLGYDPNGRTLTINQVEAETVRTIFKLYLQLGNVRLVKKEADRLGLRTKVRKKVNGRPQGGCRLSRGYIYKLLGNPIYAGRIRHGDQIFEGLHDAIIDAETWDAVQVKLADNATQRQNRKRRTQPSPLTGKLFDAAGNKLTPSHANNKGRRYRYYVSRQLIVGSDNEGDTKPSDDWRLPAAEIEGIVANAINDLIQDSASLTKAAREAGVAPRCIPDILNAVKCWNGDPFALIDQVTLGDSLIEITLNLSSITGLSDIQLKLNLPIRIKRRGVEMRLVLHAPGHADYTRHDLVLIKAVARAIGWFDDLAHGRVSTIGEIAAAHQVGSRYVVQQLRLAFLAPDIVTSILAGSQPADMTVETLVRYIYLPVDWDEQRRLLGTH
ncbi:MAG: recombinase family protein [Pseudomonadota bacterium]